MMDRSPVPDRTQCDPRLTWALTDLFPTDDAWRAALARTRERIPTLQSYAGRLGDSAGVLLEYLQLGDTVSREMDVLGNYARRKNDEDTRVPAYQEMAAQYMNLAVAIGQATAFETPELLAIDDQTLERFYRETPALGHYRLALDRVRRARAHTLSAEGEALLAAAGQMSQAPDDIFSFLNDADLAFPPAVDSQGVSHPVTHATFIPLMQSPDRTLRRAAFQSLYGVYGQFRNTFAAVLSAQMKQLQFYADARHYDSPLHAALTANEVPTEIYHNLIAAVHDGLPALHKYVALRRRLLGVDELHFYDLYTPIVADEDSEIDYATAARTACEALAPLGEDYGRRLREGLRGRWIDVYPGPGKRSGAYAAGPYGAHPFVLLNYTNKFDDMFTLVHEMGHALHSALSCERQSVTYAGYTIFVAEVASTCNESLLMQHLLRTTSDKRRRAYLINYFLEQFRATLYRQTMFAEFELWCSEQNRKGEALTAEALNAQYRALNRAYYGTEIVLDDEIALEWARIPHFYYDFYVYQYATGFSAAIALSQRILREGQPAVDDYLGFLSGGCAADPITLLRGAGVDMATPAPVRDALALFGQLVDELDALTR